MALPTVADLKVHLNVPAAATADDAEMADALDAAVEIVADIVGPLESTTVTEIHRGLHSNVLVLRRMPAASITTVSIRSGVTSTAQTLSDYELDPATGIVRNVYGGGFFGDYVIEYESGSAVLPASVRLAVLIVAAHLWETQRMPLQNDSQPAGFGGGEVPMPTSRGYALPNRALELLRPYSFPSLS
jgi:hypothetical protein